MCTVISTKNVNFALEIFVYVIIGPLCNSWSSNSAICKTHGKLFTKLSHLSPFIFLSVFNLLLMSVGSWISQKITIHLNLMNMVYLSFNVKNHHRACQPLTLPPASPPSSSIFPSLPPPYFPHWEIFYFLNFPVTPRIQAAVTLVVCTWFIFWALANFLSNLSGTWLHANRWLSIGDTGLQCGEDESSMKQNI